MSLDCIKALDIKDSQFWPRSTVHSEAIGHLTLLVVQLKKVTYIQNLKKNNGRGKKISPHKKIVTINEGHCGEISTLTR